MKGELGAGRVRNEQGGLSESHAASFGAVVLTLWALRMVVRVARVSIKGGKNQPYYNSIKPKNQWHSAILLTNTNQTH